MDNAFLVQLGKDIDDSFFLIGAAILLIEIMAGLIKKKLKWRGFADMLVNISTQIPFVLVEILVLSLAYSLYTMVQAKLIPWTFDISWWTAGLAILVADFIYYWEHRIAHIVRCLWIHHAVHHSSRYMNITTGVRFGPFEGVWSMVVLFPLVVIGFPAELIIFGSLTVLAYQTWLHTELIGSLGLIDRYLNTPANHRVHHGSDAPYLDKNFGGILIIWDRLFGTYQAELHTPRYGLDKDFDSINPFRVWFSELPALFSDVWRARSAQEVAMRFFARPEWQPQCNKSDERRKL